jgi:toxin ParE1/3/4
MTAGWTVRLSTLAAKDVRHAVRWSRKAFGTAQAHTYSGRLEALFEAIALDPWRPSASTRDDIGPGLRSLHMNTLGLRGSHTVFYSVGETTVTVLRLLHERMDPAHQMSGGSDRRRAKA